jgi:hypothetical protein
MQRVLDCMAHSCGLGPSSALLDVGAGLGRPLLHARVSHGVQRLYGVEIDRVKVAKAEAFLTQASAALSARGVDLGCEAAGEVEAVGAVEEEPEPSSSSQQEAGPVVAAAAAATASSRDATDTRADDEGGEADAAAEAAPAAPAAPAPPSPPTTDLPLITCCPVERLAPDSLAHVTHAYSFWEGVPRHARLAFGRLFASSPRARAVAVVQRAMGRGGGKGTNAAADHASAEMASLGFGPMALVRAFPVSMSGSGRSFTAYVFMKVRPIAPLRRGLPGSAAENEDDDEEAEAATAIASSKLVYLRARPSDPAAGRRASRAGGAGTAAAQAADAGSPCSKGKRSSGGGRGRGRGGAPDEVAAAAADGASPEKKARPAVPARHMTRSQSAALAAAEESDEEEVAAPPARKSLSFAARDAEPEAAGAAAAAGAPAAAAPAPAPRPPRAAVATKQSTLSFRERKSRPVVSAAAVPTTKKKDSSPPAAADAAAVATTAAAIATAQT